MRRVISRCLSVAVAVAMLGTLEVRAQETQPPAGAAKTGADPTDFITRYEPSYEHKELGSGADLDVFTLRTDFALRPDVSIRLDFPMVGFKAGTQLAGAGFESNFGLGDLVTQVMHKPWAGKKAAAIYGLRLDLDTATTPEAGQGGTTYTPLAAVAWFPTPKLLIAPFPQWKVGSDLDNLPLAGERDVNELDMQVVGLWQAKKKNLAYLSVTPEVIWDFENDADTVVEMQVEAGKAVARTALLTLKTTFGLDGDRNDFAIKLGFRHMFPGKYIFQ